MLKSLIVDDEPAARQNVRSLLEIYRPEDAFFEAENAFEALEIINEQNPRILFLDIDMPGETGIELLRKIHKTHPGIHVVFITAYAHFAIEAIKCEAFDYILKPIDEDEFKKMITRLDSKLQNAEPESGKSLEKLLQHFEGSTLKIKTKRGVDIVDFDDIVYLEAKSNYTEIIIQGKSPLMVSQTLGKLGSQLNGCSFLRIGRSHIINKKYLLGTDRVSKQVKLLAGNEPVTLSISINDIRKLEKQL
jgi:two-component system, LytTR family, response regulator